jgi:hypothetical protein
MGWDDASELRTPTGLLFIPQVTYEYGEPRWNDTDREQLKSPKETCSSDNVSTTNPIRTDSSANLGLRGERIVGG